MKGTGLMTASKGGIVFRRLSKTAGHETSGKKKKKRRFFFMLQSGKCGETTAENSDDLTEDGHYKLKLDSHPILQPGEAVSGLPDKTNGPNWLRKRKQPGQSEAEREGGGARISFILSIRVAGGPAGLLPSEERQDKLKTIHS